MDKTILDVVNSFVEWKGNPFTLAALIADKQRELDKEKLIVAGMLEAAEVL